MRNKKGQFMGKIILKADLNGIPYREICPN